MQRKVQAKQQSEKPRSTSRNSHGEQLGQIGRLVAKGSGKKKKKKKVWRDEESTFFLDFFIEIVDIDGLVRWRICLHHLCRLPSAPFQLLEEKIWERRKGSRARGPSPLAFFFFGRLPEELCVARDIRGHWDRNHSRFTLPIPRRRWLHSWRLWSCWGGTYLYRIHTSSLCSLSNIVFFFPLFFPLFFLSCLK